ncbi:MAG: NUDIX hydrolase [Muribaculaceae bacterium]|nr:NUDIX hydrolase [Muribaculaceae bacterium]
MAKEIKKWDTLESRYIIQRPWLTARVDKVRLPDGTINPEHYVLEYPDWVNIIAITRDNNFVMIRQYRHAMDQVMIELCAGMCEEGETPLQSAQRELLEETGFGGGQWAEIMTIGQNPSICDNITHCFLAQGVKKIDEQHLDQSEDIEVLIMTRQEVYDMLSNNQMLQALMAAPLWRYFATHDLTD